MIPVKRISHLVLYVADLHMMADFYQHVIGLRVAESIGDTALFLRVPGSMNHHDLGLIAIDPAQASDARSTGLYHFAWEVDSIVDLVKAEKELQGAGVLVGSSDHGASLSLYAKDPEGNEFEVFWPVPQSEWKNRGFGIWDLDLASEVRHRLGRSAPDLLDG